MSPDSGPRASIVIPAHNEQIALERLLRGLLGGARLGEFEVVVVCNGCTDRTAEVARSFGTDIAVIEVPNPSKYEALKRGDAEARSLPRVYADADIELETADLRALLRALERPGVLAAGPIRIIARRESSLLVRGYYDVWENLPQVRRGLFGRGVVAVSHLGYERVRSLPSVMSDDLEMSEAFRADERVVVDDARVVIRPPRTVWGLINRRIRVHTGNIQLDQIGGRTASAKTSLRDLLMLACQQPKLAIRLPIFLGVAAVSRAGAVRRIHRGDFDTWLRDESSRKI